MPFSLSDITDGARKLANSAGQSLGVLGDQKSTIGKVLNIVDPSNTRLALAGLLKGGARNTAAGSSPNVSFALDNTDWRVKISLAASADYFYKSTAPGIMAPLKDTDGVIFPYTPQISVTNTARYGAQNLTHSNYTNYFYEGSETQAITISGDFTVQNINEGKYLLAVIYFFRSATKMWFGSSVNNARVGAPPPMLFLSGYGSHYFPNVPCVLTSFQHTLPQDVDYISIPTDGGQEYYENDGRASTNSTLFTRVPTNSQISISLQPIYTRKNLHDNFSLDDFAAGKLIKGRGGYI